MAGQNFELTYTGHNHRLEVTDVGVSRHYSWACDGAPIVTKKSMGDRFSMAPDDAAGSTASEVLGEIHVRAGLTGVKRATLVVDDVEIDLVPEAGSPAARREERIRAHPRHHLVLHTTAAIAKVLIPLLGIGLVMSWLPDWDLPRLPLPDVDLPGIPWPSVDLPSIPWPDMQLPSWVRAVLEKAKYVWPVLLAIGIAQHEVKRRRQQDQRRSELADASTAGDERSPERHPGVDSKG